jgi:hypothetical protein
MIKSTKMSNPFIIASQARESTPSSTPRHGPKPNPLAKRYSLHAIQLALHDTTPITTTTLDGLLVQFKANNGDNAELDSSNNNLHRRSYTREQKLAATGYATTERV